MRCVLLIHSAATSQRRAPAPRQRCIFLKTNSHSGSGRPAVHEHTASGRNTSTSRPFSLLLSPHTQGLISQRADVNIQHPPPYLGRSPSLPMTTARHKEGSLHGTLPHRAHVLLLRPALGHVPNTCTYTTPSSARALRNPAGGYTHSGSTFVTFLCLCLFLHLPTHNRRWSSRNLFCDRTSGHCCTTSQ